MMILIVLFPKRTIEVYLGDCTLGKGKYSGILRTIGHTV